MLELICINANRMEFHKFLKLIHFKITLGSIMYGYFSILGAECCFLYIYCLRNELNREKLSKYLGHKSRSL